MLRTRSAATGAWLAVITGVVLAQSPAAPPGARQTLGAGSTSESGLQRGERHVYRVPLEAGQFLYLTAQQRALDVGLRLLAPDGALLMSADTMNGSFGIERIALVAPAAGDYSLEVSTGSDNPKGRYAVTVVLRAATPQDARHAAAEKTYADAEALRRQNTADARAAAIEKYREAAATFQPLGLRYETAMALYSSGILQLTGGDARGAAVSLAAALPHARALNDPLVPSVTNALGGALDILGDLTAAMAQYQEALAGFRSLGNRNGEGNAVNNIGKIHADLADWQHALEYYRMALPIWQEVKDVRREGITLNNIGVTLSNAGDVQRALDYFALAIERRRAAKDQAGEADTLSSMGLAESRLGQHRKALALLEQALTLRRTVGDKRSEALTMDYLGRTHLDLGDAQRAAACFEQALALYRGTGDKRGEAVAIGDLAAAEAALKRYPEALEHGRRALASLREIGDRSNTAGTLYLLARTARDTGDLAAAEGHVAEALRTIEEVRGRVASRQLRTAYFSNQYDVALLHVDVLMRQHRADPTAGHDVRALAVSERARARSLIDLLAESGARDLRRGADPQLIAREREVGAALGGKTARLLDLAARGSRTAEAETLAAEVRALETEYDAIDVKLRSASPAWAAMVQPAPIDVAAIQRNLLDPRTTLIEYALGEDAGYVWIVDRNRIRSARLPARAVVEAATRDVYDAVTARGRSVSGETDATRRARIAAADAALPEALAALSTMILTPVLPIAADARLLVVADGALHYLPFGMLPLPGRAARPLITRAEIVNLPSASMLAVQRGLLAGRTRAGNTLAIVADPVFDATDPRVAQSGAAAPLAPEPADRSRLLEHLAPASAQGARAVIPRLPATAAEARAITAAAGGAGLAVTGFDARKGAVTGDRLKGYRYVHFATHGFVDSENPSLSAIVLSLVDRDGRPQDGFLRADELYGLELSADMVVLSACQTGLGKEIRGEGLVGLTRGLMYAGAATVVVSLWSVSDNATAELMARFYKELISAGRSPAAALRGAQLLMLKQQRWTHPYYWSAFTIQGE